MRPGTATLLAKAERAAATAAAALERGALEVAAARAFAAVVAVGKAVANERGVRLHTHRRIAAALAASPDPELAALGRWLAAAVARRRRPEPVELVESEVASWCAHACVAVERARTRL